MTAVSTMRSENAAPALRGVCLDIEQKIPYAARKCGYRKWILLRDRASRRRTTVARRRRTSSTASVQATRRPHDALVLHALSLYDRHASLENDARATAVPLSLSP
ncbi:hypothetical protein SAMN05192563_1004337 [Paraburkholderia aspalathi]|uniref:Uncharacterized protein n=1 Tax=Paraburkholderia aspalathi TaxID=1324617 RepID=A0A1I7BBD3_9BURK|nr:hypothetical protein SAMN05192563_1004337 [Paraburkholderia aspalathi]